MASSVPPVLNYVYGVTRVKTAEIVNSLVGTTFLYHYMELDECCLSRWWSGSAGRNFNGRGYSTLPLCG